MTDSSLFIINFHAEGIESWATDEALYIPRVGDRYYPYEGPKGVFEVEEVWEVGEKYGAVVHGTHVFLRQIPMEGTRLYKLDPGYYAN